MTLNGVNGRYAALLVYAALDLKVKYIKVSATKMWRHESSFWQHMTDANIQ